MVEDVKVLILGLCKDSVMFRVHVESVVKYSESLAKKLGADIEVCVLAAWLHDIAKIDKGPKGRHHVRGAEEAERILKNFKYSDDVISKVKHCVLCHSSDDSFVPVSLEAKIVASADALAHFDNFLLLVHHYFVSKNLSLVECKEKLLKKYDKSWNKLLLPEAREIAKSKFDSINEVLN